MRVSESNIETQARSETGFFQDITIHRDTPRYAMGPDEKSPSMAGLLTSLPHWLSRKGAVLVLAAGISCLSLFFLSSFSHDMLPSFVSGVDDTSLDASSAQGLPLNETFINLPECGADRQRMASPEIWNAAEEKYGNLTDDKFTYVSTHLTILMYAQFSSC